MKLISGILLLLCIGVMNAQNPLEISGRTYTNSEDTWLGVNIPRNNPTKLIFKNNSITSKNRYGYMLQAGDEGPASTNNNLSGSVITGNKFLWTGSDEDVIPHGLFTGHNSDVTVKYNYLDHVPLGIIRKSGNNMSNNAGGVAYNIVKGSATAMVVKGMSNVKVYNNTFYGDKTRSQTWRPLLYVYTNTDDGKYSIAHGTKVYNNIFYTKYETLAITILDQESLTGFECDYNVYWCETGSPRFSLNGLELTFDEWQGMGFDLHSVVMNPKFKDLINFVPETRLDYGMDLNSEWSEGLAIDATWGTNDPALTAQNGAWQVGAVVHEGNSGSSTLVPEYRHSEIQNNSMNVIEITYTSILANITPLPSAFIVHVNSQPAAVTKVSLSGYKVILTLEKTVEKDDTVTVSYTKPSTNPLQGTSGKPAENINARIVRVSDSNEGINIFPNPAKNFFNIADLPATMQIRKIRIFDLTGKLRFVKELETDPYQKVEIHLRPGIYILQIENGSDIEHAQKLIIID